MKRITTISLLLLIGVINAIGIELSPVIKNPQLQSEETRLIQQVQNHPNNRERLYELAEFYAGHNYYPDAVELLQHITTKNPQFHQAHFLLGKLLGSQKTDPEGSLSALNKAIELQPENVKYREEIVKVYHRLQRFPPALEHLEIILQLEPNNIDAQYRKAVILYTQGNVEKAVNITKQLPEHEHAQVLYALIQQQTGNESQSLWESIVERYPNNIRARYELGKIWMKQKKWDQAQNIFETIIDQDPFYQHALFQLVKIYSVKQEKKKAQLAKQSLDVINRMGRDQRNFYRSYLQHHPDTAESHFNMANIYLEIGRGDLAADELRTVIERDGDHADAHFYLAQIYMASGDFQNAVPILETCTGLHENKAVMHSLLAQCYLELKKANEAKEHLTKALKINPTEPFALRLKQLILKAQSKP